MLSKMSIHAVSIEIKNAKTGDTILFARARGEFDESKIYEGKVIYKDERIINLFSEDMCKKREGHDGLCNRSGVRSFGKKYGHWNTAINNPYELFYFKIINQSPIQRIEVKCNG